MFDIGTFDTLTFDEGLVDIAPLVLLDDAGGIKRRKKQAKQREQQFDEVVQNSSRLREQLLKLYRGVEERKLAPSIAPEIPVQKVKPGPENLGLIARQLSDISASLTTAQQAIIREYRNEMDRQDEEDIEMLLMEIF